MRLVEGEVLELIASESDVSPQEVARLIGWQVRELTTRGDGACALHAAFGGVGSQLNIENPRGLLRSIGGAAIAGNTPTRAAGAARSHTHVPRLTVGGRSY